MCQQLHSFLRKFQFAGLEQQVVMMPMYDDDVMMRVVGATTEDERAQQTDTTYRMTPRLPAYFRGAEVVIR